MGLSLVLLLIGLMEAAVHRLQSPKSANLIQLEQSIGALGTAYPEEIFPITEWSVSVWMYGNPRTGIYIQFTDPQAYLKRTYSFSSSSVTFNEGTADFTTDFPRSGSWVFYQLGSTAVMSYGVFTTRASEQFFLSSARTISLLSSSVLTFNNARNTVITT